MPPKKQSGSTPVDAITHPGDKRVNLPTADAREFVDPAIENPFTFSYPRPLYTPQLIWRGKDEQDLGEVLEGDAPPIYIQEKIDPRVLVENLRRTAARPEDEPELTLFDDFDGISGLDIVDFYQHEANWSNRMILGDSLNVMASLVERERLRGKVQMVYIDPPYGIKFGSNWQVSARKRDVKDGKQEDATREVEQIKAFRDTWVYGINSYLSYLRDRLTIIRELLTDSGSVFVQIGDENVHLVRSLLDEVFGSENMIAQIAFAKTSGATAQFLPGTSDYVLWYAKDRARLKFNRLYETKMVGGAGGGEYRYEMSVDGTVAPVGTEPNARPFRLDNLTSPRVRENRTGYYPVEIDGRTFVPGAGEWKTHKDGMQRLILAGRVVPRANSLGYLRFIDDFPALTINTLWGDTGVAGRPGDKLYVVQTNSKIVERCLLMSTAPGDLVLDPTCGSGTTAHVSEQWGRRWITIDTSRVALALARQRIMCAKFPWYYLADSSDGRRKESESTGKPLPPTQVTNDIRHGFVYERIQHVTLKSIANNPDIKEGMSRAEIEAAIKRHAEFELLYDKPYEDKSKVRVAGPFTVESLSPYRSISFSGSAVDGTGATSVDDEAALSDSTFEQSVIENLRVGGIQNGRKQERLTFDSVETYASPYIQALGIREDADNGAPKRIGITIGPQYGTVDPSFIKDAAREANRAGNVDLLCVLGFAFDPAVLGTSGDEYVTAEDGFANVAAERQLGRVPVLLVRMNADLVMGELKKTGAGNLFTVFGEPDIDLKVSGDEVRVVLRGVDVYDPNTGELRSNDTDQIALWMIDTDYNEESFFVRHCYFTGGQDPYKRLKNALRAEINEDAWASLYSTESRTFPKPTTGKIAVKVINDYGDEVMKVFSI